MDERARPPGRDPFGHLMPCLNDMNYTVVIMVGGVVAARASKSFQNPWRFRLDPRQRFRRFPNPLGAFQKHMVSDPRSSRNKGVAVHARRRSFSKEVACYFS